MVLTATPGTAAARLSAAEAAVDGVVSKPGGLAEARDLVERCIRARRVSRVLLVDDSSTMRSIVRKILASSRFPLEISEAEEGVEALRQIATGRFDIVFLDYNMPQSDGRATLAEIKRQYPRLEVVMITSTAEDAVAERARGAGAAAFIKKPFYPADIDAVLHGIFGLRPAKEVRDHSSEAAKLKLSPRPQRNARRRPARCRRGRRHKRRTPPYPCNRCR